MGDVVPLKKVPTRLMWMCGACGCSYWAVYDDKTVECAHCETMSNNDICEWAFPAPPEDPKTAKRIKKENPDSTEFLLKSFIKDLQEDSIAVIINPDGRIYTYRGLPEDEFNLKWLRSQLKDAISMIKKDRK